MPNSKINVRYLLYSDTQWCNCINNFSPSIFHLQGFFFSETLSEKWVPRAPGCDPCALNGWVTSRLAKCRQSASSDVIGIYYYYYYFDRSCSTWNFPDQGRNVSHSSDLKHSSDNAGSLTTRPPEKPKKTDFWYRLHRTQDIFSFLCVNFFQQYLIDLDVKVLYFFCHSPLLWKWGN